MNWDILKFKISVGFRQYSSPFIMTLIPELIGLNKLANFGDVKKMKEIYCKCIEAQKSNDAQRSYEWNAPAYDFLRVISSEEIWIGEYVDEDTAEVRKLSEYLDEGECINSKITMSDFLTILEYYIDFLSGKLHRKLGYYENKKIYNND